MPSSRTVGANARSLLNDLLTEVPGARADGDEGQASATLFYGEHTFVVTLARVRRLE